MISFWACNCSLGRLVNTAESCSKFVMKFDRIASQVHQNYVILLRMTKKCRYWVGWEGVVYDSHYLHHTRICFASLAPIKRLNLISLSFRYFQLRGDSFESILGISSHWTAKLIRHGITSIDNTNGLWPNSIVATKIINKNLRVSTMIISNAMQV